MECLRKAYAACERGNYRLALEHLQDGAELAQLADDAKSHAACVRAIVMVRATVGQRHLKVLA